jgi:hypothetical protein
MTPTVPPPAPCTIRDRNSSHNDSANPNTRYATPAALSAISRAGRRPNLSENLPHIGELRSCATVKADAIRPDNIPIPRCIPRKSTPSPPSFFT